MFLSHIQSSDIATAIIEAKHAHKVVQYNNNPFLLMGLFSVLLPLMICYIILQYMPTLGGGLIGVAASACSAMFLFLFTTSVNPKMNWIEDSEYADEVKTNLKIFSNLNGTLNVYDNVMYHIYFHNQEKSLVLGIAKLNKTQFCTDVVKEEDLTLPDIASLLTQLNIKASEREATIFINNEKVSIFRLDLFKSGQPYHAYVQAQKAMLEAKEQIAKESKDKSLDNLSEEMLKLFDGLDFSKLSEVDKSMINELLINYKNATGTDKVTYLGDLVKIIQLLKEHKDNVKIKEKVSVLDYFKFKYDTSLKIKDNE